MEQLDQNLILYEFISHMSYQDIIKLCRTNKYYNQICQNNYVWSFLLKRDFDVDVGLI